MGRRSWFACVLAPLVVVCCAVCGWGAAIQWVSVSSTGEPGNDTSDWWAYITPDGRFVVFGSYANNLVPGDSNVDPANDVFVRDRVTGTTELINRNSNGEQANDISFAGGISPDGRYVTFQSGATNLVPGVTDRMVGRMFLRDRLAGTTEIVSVSASGEPSNYLTFGTLMRGVTDGRYVLFSSDADNLVPGDTNNKIDVFIRDRAMQTTALLEAPGTDKGLAEVVGASADMRFVLTRSTENLLPGDLAWSHIFVFDRAAGSLEMASLTAEGEVADGECYSAEMSPDGRYVAFAGYGTNLAASVGLDACSIFLRDRQEATTEPISVSSGGSAGYWVDLYNSQWDTDRVGGVSADGRYVSFSTCLAGLVPEDTDPYEDVFLRDRVAGTTTLISQSPGVGPAYARVCSMTPDASAIVFRAGDSEMIAGDTNGYGGVLVWDRDARFHDVPSVFWAFQHIEGCTNAGVVQGYEDNYYRPEIVVTRDQMAVFIARALAGGDAALPSGPATATFEDVPNTGYGDSGTEPYWAYNYIEYCVSRGVVKGYDSTHYNPEGPVTRDQIAVFIARAKGWVSTDDDMTAAPDLFSDVPAGFWSGAAIQACVDHSVVQGYGGGSYGPGNQVTRDQMAVYVARAFALP